MTGFIQQFRRGQPEDDDLTMAERLASTPRRLRDDARGRVNGHATIARRGARVGTLDAIRECLGEHGAQRPADIAKAIGLPRGVVETAIWRTSNSGIVGEGKKGHRKYALMASPEGQAMLRAQEEREAPANIANGEYAVATPASMWVREFKELRRDPFAFMRLALMGPR